MTYNATGVTYDVQPVDNEDGTLKALRLDVDSWSQRRSEDGRNLGPKDYTLVSRTEIDVMRVEDVMKDMASWMAYYASGQSARDSKRGLHIEGKG